MHASSKKLFRFHFFCIPTNKKVVGLKILRMKIKVTQQKSSSKTLIISLVMNEEIDYI